MMTKRTKLLCRVATLAICAAGVAAITIDGDGAVPGRASQSPSGPLDAYPGFGRSPAAAQRDDTIAAWQAFRKEQHVAACMRDAGFEYRPEITFPEGALQDVAGDLGVVPAAAPPEISAEQANSDVRAGLSADQRDRYFRALYDETAETMAASEATQGGGGDFATGGCFGSGEAAVPSVWSTYRQLEDDLDAVAQQASSDAGPRYTPCAHTNAGIDAADPGELESRLDEPRLSPRERTRRESAFETCMPVWQAAYAEAEATALDEFVGAHRGELEAQRDRYATTSQTVAADAAFRRFLADATAAQ